MILGIINLTNSKNSFDKCVVNQLTSNKNVKIPNGGSLKVLNRTYQGLRNSVGFECMRYRGYVNLINIYFKENPFNDFIIQQQNTAGPVVSDAFSPLKQDSINIINHVIKLLTITSKTT